MRGKAYFIFIVTIMGTVPILSQSIPEGVYRIISACNKDYVMDLSASKATDGNNIHLWENNRSDAQKWKVCHEGDAIVIRSVIDTNYVVDLCDSKTIYGQNIHIWKYNGTNAQRWIPEHKNGFYILRSKINQNYVIDLESSITQNGANIQCWEYNGTNAQHWKFQLLDKTIPPMLSLVDGSLSFYEPSNNNGIDANESCSIKFKIKNAGKGSANNCETRVKLSGTSSGISVENVKLPTIAAGQTYEVSIPITSNINTQDGKVVFSIEVYESNGWGIAPFNLAVSTKAIDPPHLQVVKMNISTPSGKVHRMEHITLSYAVQNIGYGFAEDVKVNVMLPDNVAVVDGKTDKSYNIIEPGEIESNQLVLIASNFYTGTSIPITIDVKEKYGKYAENKKMDVELEQTTTSVTNITVKEESETYKIVSVKDNAIEIVGTPHVNLLANTSVSILRPDWFSKYNNPQNIKSPFPYAAIKLELKGDKESIDLAKERFSLIMGGKHIVTEKDTKETNTIWFLVHCRNEFIDLDCGDGCEPINILKERLEPNRVYSGVVTIQAQ